jgi:hypothetical protein
MHAPVTSASISLKLLEFLGLRHQIDGDFLEAVRSRQVWTRSGKTSACLRHVAKISGYFQDHDTCRGSGDCVVDTACSRKTSTFDMLFRAIYLIARANQNACGP